VVVRVVDADEVSQGIAGLCRKPECGKRRFRVPARIRSGKAARGAGCRTALPRMSENAFPRKRFPVPDVGREFGNFDRLSHDRALEACLHAQYSIRNYSVFPAEISTWSHQFDCECQ
jgi:hypothetical protein